MSLSRLDFSKFSSVTSDSRQVKPGSLFVAVRGGKQNGHDYIDEVVSKGAAAIIGEEPLGKSLNIPYEQVADSRLALAEAAGQFYGNPSQQLKMAAVTGTCGKTTCTYVLESILHAAGFKVGVIGTVNFRYGTREDAHVLPSTHTTPGPVELQGLLSQMKSAGVTHVIMEVSSHALIQRRAHGIAFDAMAFTNLTPEHLDFHGDMENYFSAKKILFTELYEGAKTVGKTPVRIFNWDDLYAQRLSLELTESAICFSVTASQNSSSSDFISGEKLNDSLDGISGLITLKGHWIPITSSLTGRFNISNLLTAAALAKGLGISHAAISEGISLLRGVSGRLERVPNAKGIHVFVDYAHKPDALEKVLNTLQAFRAAHRLITVFGCGGDRDRNKRPVMGKTAQSLSDCVYVTSDNPRTENPDAIIQEILKGMSVSGLGTVLFIESDRRKAIHAALALARPGDLVLIAGKGHEDYQIIGSQKFPFDDRKIAQEALDQP